jgi:hypothetical protein
LVQAAEYENLRIVLVRRAPVRTHIVKIDWPAVVWIRLPIE